MELIKAREETKPVTQSESDPTHSFPLGTASWDRDSVLLLFLILSGYFIFIVGIFIVCTMANGLPTALWGFGKLLGGCVLGFGVLGGWDEWQWSRSNAAEGIEEIAKDYVVKTV